MLMFSLNMEIAAQLGASTIQSDIVDKELSILTTVKELWDDQRILVAMLIFAFSVCVPLLKATLISVAYFSRAKSGKALQKIIQMFDNPFGCLQLWEMSDIIKLNNVRVWYCI